MMRSERYGAIIGVEHGRVVQIQSTFSRRASGCEADGWPRRREFVSVYIDVSTRVRVRVETARTSGRRAGGRWAWGPLSRPAITHGRANQWITDPRRSGWTVRAGNRNREPNVRTQPQDRET